MDKILVAATPEGQQQASNALSELYQLVFAKTVTQAVNLLTATADSDFKAIIADVHLDESRMFDLLQFVRSSNRFDNVPFIIIQANASVLDILHNLDGVSQTLGAVGLLDLSSHPETRASSLLKAAVENALADIKPD